MSMSKFSGKPNSAASAANVRYICRESQAASISFHNLPELESGDRDENRFSAIAYAAEREEDEQGKRGDRNHYRMILAFDRNVSTEQANQLTHEYLASEFPDARAIVAIHQHQKTDADREKIRDEQHTHAHVWIDARQENGKKLHMSRDRYQTMSDRWESLYDREFGTNYREEFAEKKVETRKWQREYAIAKENGLPLPEKPERAEDNFRANDYREKDQRDIGVETHANETADNRNQRSTSIGHEQIEISESAVSQSEYTIDGAYHRFNAADERLNGAEIEINEGLRGEAEILAERELEHGAERNEMER